LQDIGGGHPVDDFGAAFAGHVVGDHLAGDGGGRQPLVPERDGQVAQRQDVARELPHRLGARAVAAGQRQRQADHQPADAVPIDERKQSREDVKTQADIKNQADNTQIKAAATQVDNMVKLATVQQKAHDSAQNQLRPQ